MSTIKTENLSNLAGTKTIPVDRVASGVAAAWVNFNGTGTVAIRASYNVSSITDNGTGDYTVNLTNALDDNNFAAVVAGSEATGGANNVFHHATLYRPSNPFTSSSVRLRTGAADSGSGIDFTYVTLAVFR